MDEIHKAESTTNSPPIPLLVEKFEILRESFLEMPEQKAFEQKKLIFDQQAIADSVNEIFEAWEYVFQADDFLKALTNQSEESKKYLKKVRRFGLILKSLYNFFSQKHSTPENLHIFLHDLGEYNDLVTAGQTLSERGKVLNVSLIKYASLVK